jgi:hypothetical protein
MIGKSTNQDGAIDLFPSRSKLFDDRVTSIGCFHFGVDINFRPV